MPLKLIPESAKQLEKTTKYYAVPNMTFGSSLFNGFSSVKDATINFFNKNALRGGNSTELERSFFLFESKQSAEKWPSGKFARPLVCEVLLTPGTQIQNGKTIRASNEKTGKYSDIDYKSSINSVSFVPSDRSVILLSHEGDYKNKDLVPVSYPSSYSKLFVTKGVDSYASELIKIYQDYAHPTGGWFLSGHWKRSSRNINFVDTTLCSKIKQLNNDIANDPQKLADWLITQIKESGIKMNPQGSFMRRTRFIISNLIEIADKQSKNELILDEKKPLLTAKIP